MNEKRIRKKSITSGLLYNGIYQIITIVAPLLTSPYISRTMGIDAYGVFNYTNSIAYYFFIVGMLGVNSYGNREIAKVRDDREKRSNVFWQIYYLQLCLGILVSAAYFIYCLTFVKENRPFFILQGLYVLSVCTDINWYAFGQEEFRFITGRNLVIKLLTVILIFTLIHSPNDLPAYFCIILLGNILGLLAVWPYVLRTTRHVSPDIGAMLSHLKPNFLLFLPYIASSVYQRMDKVMIGSIVSTKEVGFYNYAENILSIPIGFMTAISNVMLPRTAYLVKAGHEKEANQLLQLSIKLSGVLNIGLTFGLFALSGIFVPWYLGPEHTYTAQLLQILAVSLVISGISDIIRNQFLIPRDMDKEYIISVSGGAVINAVLNFVMIRHLGAIGACVATVVSYCGVFLIQLMLTHKQIRYGKTLIRVLPYYLPGLAMYVLINRINNILHFNTVTTLAVDFLLGAAAYGIMSALIMFVLDRQLFDLVIDKLKVYIRLKK